MKNRVGRIIIGLLALVLLGAYTYRQEQIHWHSNDIAAWGPATGLHPEGFEADHAMQANFYAWVLMKEGYRAVTCKFVALQRDDGVPAGQPLVATYRFDEENPPRLDW